VVTNMRKQLFSVTRELQGNGFTTINWFTSKAAVVRHVRVPNLVKATVKAYRNGLLYSYDVESDFRITNYMAVK
jgi:hypothetical protein